MLTVSLKDAEASFSSLVDRAIKGEFVTITHHGKPVAVLVSVEAAEIARKAIERTRSSLVAYLKLFLAGSSNATARHRGMSSFEWAGQLEAGAISAGHDPGPAEENGGLARTLPRITAPSC